tara:strand:- start:255 stop:1526 length:1272 start_codon:yes stop_codon:yes gene_type:complete
VAEEIYNYDNDIKFDINLSLLSKSNPNSFLYSLSEQLGLIGNKKNKYSNHLSCISANLMLLYLNRVGEFVYYSRDHNHYKSIARYNPLKISIRKIKKIITLLIKHQFIDHRKGRYIRYDKELSYRSRFRPTTKFLNFMRQYFVKRQHIYRLDSDVIILKNSEKYLKDYLDDEYTDMIRSDCSGYNNSLSFTKINLSKTKQVKDYLRERNINLRNKSYQRIFNGDFKHGGRFYGPWWLNIPSELRQFITINNKKTVEYDYSSLIIHQIYSDVGLNYFEENTYSDDPYLLRGIPDTERKLNKAIIQIALNCSDLDSLNAALLRQYKKGKLTGNKPRKKEIEKRLNIFKEMNPRIADYVYKQIALRFQFQDSEIARKIINRCSRYLIPVLSIHDSFIVEETNSNFIIDTMNNAIKNAGLTSVPLIK